MHRNRSLQHSTYASITTFPAQRLPALLNRTTRCVRAIPTGKQPPPETLLDNVLRGPGHEEQVAPPIQITAELQRTSMKPLGQPQGQASKTLTQQQFGLR
ncbi:hypothetical protein KIL84_010227 [Mauremys mutica]|uniref:Uncharacterized protein n=1 Tax=Mauremys mutica TaxID=74926 RepID=A0A9D4B5U2_9SAUR|nr:hypothetical protein KIL84_010227 [Mauremys mutica]